MSLAYHFGLFLQKVNILKDQQEDEAAGRFLVPDRRALLASLRDNARGALQYILALPRGERGYRIFCAWSLMIGAVTGRQFERHGRAGAPRPPSSSRAPRRSWTTTSRSRGCSSS